MLPHENLDLQDMDGEVWKPVVGYEQFYHVSNMGRVKALERKAAINKRGVMNKRYPEKILKQINGDGYTRVKLCKDNIVKSTNVHRIVCIAFTPNHENKPFVNHKNGTRNDNRVENLEWVTHRENIIHAYKILGVKSPIGVDRYWSGKKIYQYSKGGELINTWCNSEEIKRQTGMCNSSIKMCCNGKIKTSKGYIWSHAELPKEFF